MAPTPDSGTISSPPTLEEMLKKNLELSRTDLEYLQDWMRKQPHLPKLTDEQLVPFLHSNYYSLEKTKTTIENYFTIRTHAPDMFLNRDALDPAVKKHLSIINLGRLSKRDSRGYKIITTRWNNPDPNEMEFETSIKVVLMTIEQELREDPTCPGFIIIMDQRETSMGHIAKSSVSSIKVILTYIQEATPCRIKELHVIYCSALMDTILRIIKPFLHKELMSMIHLHSGEMEAFYKIFPKDILPKDFEGELSDLKEIHAANVKRLETNRSWFLEQDKLLVDETKRPGKAKSAGEVFGLEGSFKKLDID
ncbi:alpha-tocopherol transfer protein-like [Anabrus simplex]|uniref:alpha-tocopherol transfer protein-like n=1 Tax=Anabrus simplex TaxID=316456 RepID=UPI0034DDA0FE